MWRTMDWLNHRTAPSHMILCAVSTRSPTFGYGAGGLLLPAEKWLTVHLPFFVQPTPPPKKTPEQERPNGAACRSIQWSDLADVTVSPPPRYALTLSLLLFLHNGTVARAEEWNIVVVWIRLSSRLFSPNNPSCEFRRTLQLRTTALLQHVCMAFKH